MGKIETNLAQFVLDFPTERVPEEIIHLAKRCLMNYAGVALDATLDPASNIMLDFLRAEGCAEQATVVGSGLRTSAQNAALMNGFSGHFEDYDDTHPTVIHPTAPILPARWRWASCAASAGESFYQRSPSASRSLAASAW